jgi:CHASE2 domain-containing sensor protein
VAISLVVYLWNPQFFHRLELDTIDMRFDVRGDKAAPRDVALVLIDDATMRDFADKTGNLPRALQGRLIDRVNAGRPRAIAEDIKFLEARSPAGDRALIAAMQRARSRLVVASPFTFTVTNGAVEAPSLFEQDDFFEKTRIQHGWPGVPWDPEKVVRRIEYEIAPVPDTDPGATFSTFAAQTAEVAGVDADRLPSGASRRAVGRQAERTTWIDFHGGPGTFRTVSARDVLRGRVESQAFRDKVVVIGLGAWGEDLHRTSVDDDATMLGPELQANAISTMLRGAPLQDAPRIVDLLLIAALGLVPLLAWTLRWWPATLAVVVGAALAFLVGAQLLFAAGEIVAVVAPLFALALATLGILVVQALQAGMRRRRARPAT